MFARTMITIKEDKKAKIDFFTFKPVIMYNFRVISKDNLLFSPLINLTVTNKHSKTLDIIVIFSHCVFC